VNRDGRVDIVVGSHFSHPWRMGGVAVRLYLNRGVQDGEPAFEDVTEQAGLKPLPMKSPHVEIQDFDNDGWPDIYTSIVKFKGAEPHPVIFKNVTKGETPKFQESALAVNDFPTAGRPRPARQRGRVLREDDERRAEDRLHRARAERRLSTATDGSTCSWPTGGSRRLRCCSAMRLPPAAGSMWRWKAPRG
jgi:hypothetical protein